MLGRGVVGATPFSRAARPGNRDARIAQRARIWGDSAIRIAAAPALACGDIRRERVRHQQDGAGLHGDAGRELLQRPLRGRRGQGLHDHLLAVRQSPAVV